MKELVIKKIKIPLYNSKVIIVLFYSEDYDKAVKYLKRKKVAYEDFDKKCDGIFYCLPDSDRCDFLLLIRRNKDEVETAVHETWHLNQEILEYHGVEYKKGGNNETHAYLMGVLTKKILALLTDDSKDNKEVSINTGESQSL